MNHLLEYGQCVAHQTAAYLWYYQVKTFIVSRCLADCSTTILHTQVVTHGSETIIQQEFVVFVVLAVATALSFPLFAHNTHTHAFCSQ